MAQLSKLEDIVSSYSSMLVGFSGGVDSTLLAVVGTQVLGNANCLAVTGKSPSLSSIQLQQATRLAHDFELSWETVETLEMNDSRYVANPQDRCFFCKSELWQRLTPLARERGIAVVVDGTNASDVTGHRPGKKAGSLSGVRSPLAEAGITKDMVREFARELEIPIWDAPASPCLSSRILYGLPVTENRLGQVERGEQLLRDLGIEGDLRLRHRGGEARIEVHSSQMELLRGNGQKVAADLQRLGFSRVTMDLAGYKSGSMLDEHHNDIEVLAES